MYLLWTWRLLSRRRDRVPHTAALCWSLCALRSNTIWCRSTRSTARRSISRMRPVLTFLLTEEERHDDCDSKTLSAVDAPHQSRTARKLLKSKMIDERSDPAVDYSSSNSPALEPPKPKIILSFFLDKVLVPRKPLHLINLFPNPQIAKLKISLSSNLPCCRGGDACDACDKSQLLTQQPKRSVKPAAPPTTTSKVL